MSKRPFPIGRRALLVSSASAFVLSACSNIIGPPNSAPLYLLDPRNPPAQGGTPVRWQLTVVLPLASDSLDTMRIMLVQPSGQMDYYANSNWQDRLPFLIQGSLVEAFEESGRLPAVGRDSAGRVGPTSADSRRSGRPDVRVGRSALTHGSKYLAGQARSRPAARPDRFQFSQGERRGCFLGRSAAE
jgi:hypothetical protein